MKIEVGKTYETRDGLLARVICVDRKFMGNAPVIALVTHANGMEWTCGYNAEGVSPGDSRHDLVREHVPVTYRWYRVFENKEVGMAWEKSSVNAPTDIGLIKLAFDPSGNLVIDKCEITGAQPNG